ncbi:ADP-ribosylation factor-like protein 6-interacting protein 6 [Centroberyx affinis]|uniref:ADP-ribosylation factor-like protein 6-interacting protein 6 n=1 Tax=Centroberyx affinis TaxID=166261 RepID=UPI003A5BB029
MPRSAVTDTDVFGESVGRLSSTEGVEHAATVSLRTGINVASGEGPGMTRGQRFDHRNGSKPWPVLVLSTLGSALALAAVGAFCALLYPLLKELRAERVRAEDGTEVRMLGFWSILVLSVSAGFICCAFSWTLTYLDSYKPGMVFPTPLALSQLRHAPGQGFHVGYTVAVLNGIMATLTVIWSLI